MFKNYFIVAIRNLWRNKILSFINISGLSLGLACCMLIFLYAKDELSYDGFHEKKDQIYRITARMVNDEGTEEYKGGKTGMIHGPSFKQDIPEIREFVRVSRGEFVIRTNHQIYNQEIKFVDENFFSVFSFPLISGDPRHVLADLHSMVISEETAKKYFGSSRAEGKTMELQVNGKFEPFIISGIAKRSPENSSIKFEILLPMKYQEKINPDLHWLNFFISTFLVLQPGADPAVVLNKMTRVYYEKARDQLKEAREKDGFKDKVYWGLQPLMQIHLSKDYAAEDELSDASNPVYSYILTGIAIFIMLIACINFINLTIARSLKRSKEIGLRKVIGGRRAQLARQFLGESFLVCFISFVFAIFLATISLPVFNELANKRLSLTYLLDAPLVAGFIGLFLITGFAAGLYPALILSGFDPVQTLYHRVKLSGKNLLARSLIVVQFVVAGLLIISTFFIYEQFHYLTHAPLGYNDQNLVVVEGSWDADKDFADLFKAALVRNPVIQIAAVHNRGRQGTEGKVDGRDIQFDYDHIDDQYLPALQIPIIKGRNFSADFPTDSTNSVLVNEAFAREAGWKDPIGKTVDLFWRNRKLTVVGLVKDFHFRSFKEKIGPQIFSSEPEGNSSQFYIRINPDSKPQTLRFIETAFKQLSPFYPFSYQFKDDVNRHVYESEEKWKQIILFSAILTIFISCIGLLGLTALSAEQRTKEIGIRKVLGASVRSILQLITSNFVKLVLLANLIALPIAWWAVHKWLENFAYHISVHWWEFGITACITLLIAMITIGFNAMKAAVANPVTNLRSE